MSLHTNRFFISLCFIFSGGLGLMAQSGETGLKCHTPSASFLSNDNPDCFEITKNEADRAFSKGCWDDAGKLYRAAKLCRNANQVDRSAMNARIEACRKAAEDELRAEQIKAERQARQAIATNRAIEANNLLEQYDRNTAYRLAKFANDYIAPPGESNPDCLQTIFDAWQFKTQEAEGNIRKLAPFSYLLLNTYDTKVRLQFTREKGNTNLYAFSPLRHELYQWTAPDFAPHKPVKTDTTFTDFHVSKDGRAQLFTAPGRFSVSDNHGEPYTINLIKNGAWTFGGRGEFIYFDIESMGVHSVNYANQSAYNFKDKSRKNSTSTNSKSVCTYLDFVPDDMGYKNGHIWLLEQDTLIFLKQAGGGEYVPFQTLLLDFQVNNKPKGKSYFRLNKETGVVYRSAGNSVAMLQVIYKDGRYSTENMAVGTGHLVSSDPIWEEWNYQTGTSLQIYQDPNTIFQLNMDADNPLTDERSGALARAGEGSDALPEWLAVANPNGDIILSKLSDHFSVQNSSIYPGKFTIAISPDGRQVANAAIAMEVQLITDNTKESILGMAPFPGQWSSNDVILKVNNKGWAACSLNGGDTLKLYGAGKTWNFTCDNCNFTEFCFSTDDRYFSFVSDVDSVSVFELKGNDIVAVNHQRFDYFVIGMHFIPGKNALIVQRTIQGDIPPTSVSLPRIWYFKEKPAKTASVRLENYNPNLFSTTLDGNKMLFSDSRGIKIFSPDTLTEEALSIRERKNAYITSIACHPTADIVAVAYSDNIIYFRDLRNGRKLFTINGQSLACSANKSSISYIGFADNGDKLTVVNQCIGADSVNLNIASTDVHNFDLSVDDIENQLKISGGELVALSIDQIGQLELDKALDYPGNFEKLARSKDRPMIQAFFSFFSEQAQYSNNIRDVAAYCDRAALLYNLLDDESQTSQYKTMLTMYDNYLWKLIQRNQTDAATAVLRKLESNNLFKNAIPLYKASGHINLLRGDEQKALQDYIEWAVNVGNEIPDDYERASPQQQISDEFNQMNEYGMLQQQQRNVVCALFGQFLMLNQEFCTEAEIPALNQLLRHQPSLLRWNIFQGFLDGENYIGQPFNQQGEIIENLKKNIKLYSRYDRKGAQKWETDLILLEAKYWRRMAAQESTNTARADNMLTESLNLLRNMPPVEDSREKMRQIDIADLLLERGNKFLFANPKQAYPYYIESYRILYELDSITRLRSEPLPDQVTRLAAALFTQMGMAELLLNHPANARANFESSLEILPQGINSYYEAMSYFVQDTLDEGDKTAMYLSLGEVRTDEDLAAVLRLMEILIQNSSGSMMKMARLNQRKNEIIAALERAHPEINTAVADFQKHLGLMDYFDVTGQKKRVMEEAELTLTSGQNLMNANPEWTSNYLIAVIYYGFYSVLYQSNDMTQMKKVISITEELMELTKDANYQYQELLPSNLGHAYLLTGDKVHALEQYRLFAEKLKYNDVNPYDILVKDWRDLHKEGVILPGLANIISELLPQDYPLSAQDRKDIGL